MGFVARIFGKSLGNQEKESDRRPLKEKITSYEEKISAQKEVLNRSLEIIQTASHTSLDVILSKSLGILKNALIEYGRLLEDVLVAKKVIERNGARKRNVVSLVDIAQRQLKFYGGNDAVATIKFLQKMKDQFLSSVEDNEYQKCIKALIKELDLLRLYISKN